MTAARMAEYLPTAKTADGYPATMRRKPGLMASSATGMVTALLLVVAPVVRSTTDNPELARPPGESAQLSGAQMSKTPQLSRPAEGEQSPSSRYSPSASSPSLDFDLSSFNVLGSSHTEPGGSKAQMASGPTRMRWAARLLTRHGVDVVGFQEIQLDQVQTFVRVRGGTYDIYPGSSAGGRAAQNSIAWRTDMWSRVRASTVPIPYFDGNTVPMPVVLLRHRATGVKAYFTNFHNPATTRGHPNQERWRRQALLQEIALVNRLNRETGRPVFLTGDLNEREVAFCMMTDRAPMIAANGGSNDGACRPPRPMGVDWIFGSIRVKFSNYRADRSPLVTRTTDHPMIVSHVRIGAG